MEFLATLEGGLDAWPVRPVLDLANAVLEPAVGPAVDWADAHASAHTAGYPLMGRGRDVFALAALYLASVPVLCWAVRFFPARPLKGLSLVHNAVLVALSTYMALGIGYEYLRMAAREGKPICLTEDPRDTRLANILFIFFLSKLYEFLDTYIMIFKHKFAQVSFLHVYHHSTILPYWWLIVRTTPGGDAWLTAFLNSGVHVVMYSYYLLAALRVTVTWKAWVTRGQMVQFGLFLVQSVYVTVTACHTGAIAVIGKGLIAYAVSLLALFANFYVQAYMAKGSAAGKGAGSKGKGKGKAKRA